MKDSEELGSGAKGKQAELLVFGELLRHSFQVYTPMVDSGGVDCLVDVGKGNYREIQVKWRTKKKAQFFQVRKFKPRSSFYIACCLGTGSEAELWLIPSQVFYTKGKRAKANGREYVRLTVGGESSASYDMLRRYSYNFTQLTKGASKEVKQAVKQASQRIDKPHLTQTDHALAILDNLSLARTLSSKEIANKVYVSLSSRFSEVDVARLTGGRKRWQTSVSFAISALKKRHFIEEKDKNEYAITQEGTKYLYSTHKGIHIVPGHPAGPFGYTGTIAAHEKGIVRT